MKYIIKIALMNSNVLFCKALVSLLSTYENIIIVYEGSTEDELIKILKQNVADIVLLDSEAMESDVIESLKVIKNIFPNIKIIVLNILDDEVFIAKFIIGGVNGFLTKQSTVEALLETIKGVYNNRYYFKQNITSHIMQEIRESKKSQTVFLALTSREKEVLHLICKGKSHKQIADVLFITTRTVDFHKSNIYKKTNTNTAVNLYEYALANHLI